MVTAQKRAESLQDAALAVSAVSGQGLEDAGVTDVTSLGSIVPSLQISNAYGPSNNFYLRGVGNFVTNALSDGAIAFNVDGINYARPTSAQGVFFDLDRIEVIKGPQGTLYGKNATGGAINVITKQAELGELSGYGTLELANYNAKKLTGAINVPVAEDSALRVAAQTASRDGFYSDDRGDLDTDAIRISYLNQLSDTVTLKVNSDYFQEGGNGPGATYKVLDADDRIGLFDPRAEAVIGSTFVFLSGDFLQPLPEDDYYDNNFGGISAQLDWDLDIGTLTFMPAYRKSELDFRTYSSGFGITQRETDEQTSLEVRLVSDSDGPLDYIVGAFYMKESIEARINYNQQGWASFANFQPDTDSYAAFVRLTYSLTDQFRLTGAVRYTMDDKSADIGAYNTLLICPSILGGGPACADGEMLPNSLTVPDAFVDADGNPIPVVPYGSVGKIAQTSFNAFETTKKFEKVTYRAGIEYDVNADSLLYATFETGFKSGGFFQSIDDPSFEPETIEAYTLGSKNRFLEDRLQLNMEAFHWTYKDQQISHFRLNSAGGTEFVTENIGESKLQGLEVELKALLLESTVFDLSVQYLDAEMTDFVYYNPDFLGVPVTGCDVSGPSAGLYGFDCSDRRPVQAPEWTYSASIEHAISLGDLGELSLSLRTRYQSEIYTGLDLLPSYRDDSYFITDAIVSFESADYRYRVSAFVNNLTDESVMGFSQPHPRASSLLKTNLGNPRIFGLRVGVNF